MENIYDKKELVELLLNETLAICDDYRHSMREVVKENRDVRGHGMGMFFLGLNCVVSEMGAQETKNRLYEKLESYLEGKGKTDGI